MRTLRSVAFVACLAAWAVAAPAPARAADAPAPAPAPPAPPPAAAPAGDASSDKVPAPAWRDVGALDAHLRLATGFVEAVCGATYAAKPTVRVSTAADVTDVLLGIEEKLGLEPRSERAAVRVLAGALFAFTDYTTGTIHVLPDNVERMAAERRTPALVSSDVLLVVLVHEAVHALDWARWGWVAHRKTLKTGDELQAFSAIAEGHAQLVAEDVAVAQGRRAAFETMTSAIVALPDDLPPAARAMAQAAVAEAAFGYVVGHRFLRAVREVRGPEGVDELLRTPPRETRVVEDPRRYLGLAPEPEPAAVATPVDLDAVMRVFEPLVADKRWRTQRDRARHAALASQASRFPPERRATFLSGYEDGRIVAAGLARGAQVLVIVLLFRTPADAQAFVRDDRDLGKIGEEEAAKSGIAVTVSAYLDGSGTDGLLPGYRYAKKLAVPGGETTLVGGDTLAGRCVASVIAINAPWITKEALAATADRFAMAVQDPVAARAMPALPTIAVPAADAPEPEKGSPPGPR